MLMGDPVGRMPIMTIMLVLEISIVSRNGFNVYGLKNTPGLYIELTLFHGTCEARCNYL